MRLHRYAKKKSKIKLTKNNMTNEEKARDLATEYSCWLEKCETLEDYYGNSQMYIEGKLLKMAKWKEQQIIEILQNINTWHLTEKEDIYNAIKDWKLHAFLCVMKDGTIQKFNGIKIENYDGFISTHIYCANNNYDNVDDIIKWFELT